MLKGLTVQYLLRQTFDVGPGTVLLGHAAAGGVGLILGQWAKALGATVIGTASTRPSATWRSPTATTTCSPTGTRASTSPPPCAT